jgi:hypothetical protein
MAITTKMHGFPKEVSKGNVGTLMEYSADATKGYYVVLMTGRGDAESTFAGVVVHTDKSLWPLGDYSTKWSREDFSEFKSKISLTYKDAE